MIPPVNTHVRWPRLRWSVFTLVALFLVASGCSVDFLPADDSSDSEPDPVPTGTAAAEPETGGSLIVAIPEEPESLNFSLITSASAHWVLSTIDSRMIRVNSENEY